MTPWRFPINITFKAPLPQRLKVSPRDVPGFGQTKRGEVIFPWSGGKLVERFYRAPPAAWLGAKAIPGQPTTREDLSALLKNQELVRDYQVAEVNRGLRLGGGHLWTSPGAGKTIMGLVWGATLALRSQAPLLYVTRACLRGQVELEVEKWFAPGAVTPILLRPKSTRRAYYRDDLHEQLLRAVGVPIVIVGWEQLRDETFSRDEPPLWQRLAPIGVVFDETQFAKNEKRVKYSRSIDDNSWQEELQQTIAGAALVTAQHVPCRLGLTATPGETDREDLWGQLALIEPHAWGNTSRSFILRYCGAVRHPEAGGVVPAHVLTTRVDDGAYGITNSKEFWARLDLVARRIPYEVTHGHLPPLHRHVDLVSRADQDRPGPDLKKQRRALVKRADGGDPSARALLRELEYEEAADRVRTRTIEALRQRRRTGKGKVILFTGRKALADKLEGGVKRAGFDTFILHGDIPDVEFHARLQTYNNHPGPCVAIGTPNKLGTGFNMPDTDLVLFSMLPDRVGLLEQAERRADRVTRTRPLEILYLIPQGTQVEKDLRRLRDYAKTTADVHAGSGLDDLEELFDLRRDRKLVLMELAEKLAQSLA